VTAALLAGAGVGLGLMLVVAAVRPAAPTIAARLAEIDAARWSSPTLPTTSGSWQARVGGWLVGHGVDRSWITPPVRSDLAITGGDAQMFLTHKLMSAVTGFLVPSLLTAVLLAAGAPIPVLVPAWAAVAATAVGFLLPDVRLRQAAAGRRRSFRAALGAYLDLVAMRMASGAGLAEALGEAATVGDGFAFEALRGALADARIDGTTPAAALRRLGEQLVVADLVDTALRLSLVDSSGAQAQMSLQAQAATLRDRELTDVQGRANERSQSMLVAQVVLGIGFVIFLGYPAVAKVLAT